MTTRLRVRLPIFCLATALSLACAGGNAKADLVTTNPDLPPIGGVYMTAAQVHAAYPGIDITEAQHHILMLESRSSVGGNDLETINSQLTGLVSVGGGPATPFTLTGPVQIEVFSYVPGQLGTFSTQMLSMDLTGSVAGHSVEIMVDPGLGSSTGMTTISSLGNGLFNIHSFFDVFTEIRLDHGAFLPQNNGPSVVSLQPAIPEPSSWVMGAMAATAGLVYAGWRRRRAA